MLQALDILESFDLQAMGFNSARYIHTLYQVDEPRLRRPRLLLRRPLLPTRRADRGTAVEGVRQAARSDHRPGRSNDPTVKPGDPYPFQGGKNPYLDLLRRGRRCRRRRRRRCSTGARAGAVRGGVPRRHHLDRGRRRGRLGGLGDAERRLGAGGDRRQDRRRPLAAHAELRARPGAEPVQRAGAREAPRAHASPRPRHSRTASRSCRWPVQGGDTQDQNLLQFFLDVVEFGMNVQQAAEAPNILELPDAKLVRRPPRSARPHPAERADSAVGAGEARGHGLRGRVRRATSGPINAIYFDQEQERFRGAPATTGEDYGEPSGTPRFLLFPMFPEYFVLKQFQANSWFCNFCYIGHPIVCNCPLPLVRIAARLGALPSEGRCQRGARLVSGPLVSTRILGPLNDQTRSFAAGGHGCPASAPMLLCTLAAQAGRKRLAIDLRPKVVLRVRNRRRDAGRRLVGGLADPREHLPDFLPGQNSEREGRAVRGEPQDDHRGPYRFLYLQFNVWNGGERRLMFTTATDNVDGGRRQHRGAAGQRGHCFGGSGDEGAAARGPRRRGSCPRATTGASPGSGISRTRC